MADGESPQPPPPLEDGVSMPLLQSNSHISYSQIVQGPLFKCRLDIDRHVDDFHLKPISVFQGKPCVIFKASEKSILLGKMNFVLVGKFSHGRPPLVKIKAFLFGLKLQGSYNVSIFDHKHVFMEFNFKSDFNRVWLGLAWSIHGYTMRVFKWEADFSPNRESSTAPVWVRFQGIPLYLFDEVSLMSIANAVGNPLRVDPKNLNGTKLNYAHVCVELDVAAPLVDSIWVGFEEDDSQIILDGIWIKVIYDVIPPLLSACYHLGHVLGMCKRGKLEVTHSLGAGSESMVGADKVFDTLSQRESATSRTEGQGVGKVFDKRPHTRKTTAPQPGRKPGSFGTQPGTKELTLRGWKAVQNLDLTNVDLGGKQGTMNKALKTPVLGANETSSTAQCHCSGSDSSDQVARIVVEPKLTETKEQPGTRGVMCDEPSSFTEAEDHGLQINVKSVSEGKNGSEDSGSLVADQVLDNLPQPGKSPKSAHSEVHSVLFYGKAESYKEVSQPEEESVEAKVFVNLTQSSPQSDPPSGNSAGTFLEATTPEVATGFFSPVMQQVEDPSADLEVGIKYICSTVETSDVTTNNPQFHTPNLKWVEVPKLLGKSPDNGIIQGKYRGTDLISCKKKVDSFIKDVEDLWGQIDKADSTTISRIGESPATKVFLKTHFERCNFNPLPTDLMDNEVIQDPCTKFELPTGGQTTNMVSQDQGHLVTVLPKLCYEQVSKSQGAQKWRTTVQIAPISEGLGIVRAALLQLEDKERVTEMRGQRLPFDDKG